MPLVKVLLLGYNHNHSEKNQKLCTKVDLVFINRTSFRELFRQVQQKKNFFNHDHDTHMYNCPSNGQEFKNVTRLALVFVF